MKIILLTGLLLPLVAITQEVKPVLSADYLALVRHDSLNIKKYKTAGSGNSISKSPLRFNGYNFYGGFTVKKISIANGNTVSLHPDLSKELSIAGNVSATIELQHVNRLPAVQKEYVQGRSLDGSLAWQGPETNELFSFGPSVHTLEFDGNNYPYDVNGRLVAAGTGHVKKAIAYTPSIFRTAALFSNAFTLQTKYRRGYQRQLSTIFKAGQRRENSFIVANKNKTDNFSASAEGIISGLTISGGYIYRNEHFSNSNRAGFLNRLYQNTLLSPISFDNSQGNTIGNMQRSYSYQADNPFFLLSNTGHLFQQQQNTGHFTLEQKFNDLKIRLTQSYENLQEQSDEGYQPGTAFFQNGITLKRSARNANYFLDANVQYTIPFDDYEYNALITANYIYANDHSDIGYSYNNAVYSYQRSSHDAAIGFSPSYHHDNFETGLNLLNKIYASNTVSGNNFFLPSVSGFMRFNNLFTNYSFFVKLTGTYSRFNSELPINRSFAQTSLVQYKVAEAFQYLPITEASSFDNLLPVQHREYTAGLEISYENKITLSADWFSRNTNNDVFPLMNGGKFQLSNIAAHINRGIELQLKTYPRFVNNGKIYFYNTISFLSYGSKVTGVNPGYNFTPTAGFSDVHKAIVKGAPLGAIVGNTFLKDANNNIVTGTDGFPLVNNTLSVIGNPEPDFIIKMSNRLAWKKWTLDIDWQWKKGGDIWNGTAASLDYFGRSAGTAALRNTVNYIFDGVNENGAHNTVPVSFYDPSLPVEKNRWTRYGQSGVAEAYIEKADCIRLSNISLSFRPTFKKYLRELGFTLYTSNILLWSAYKGADPNQLLNDQPDTAGLDFFNLPSFRSFGLTVSLQF